MGSVVQGLLGTQQVERLGNKKNPKSMDLTNGSKEQVKLYFYYSSFSGVFFEECLASSPWLGNK
jgi:hypothetical protein